SLPPINTYSLSLHDALPIYTITFDDFVKLDMRVGTILEAEKMPKADKLLILKVDVGIDTRTVVSGIAESFSPDDIIGKKVTVVKIGRAQSELQSRENLVCRL